MVTIRPDWKPVRCTGRSDVKGTKERLRPKPSKKRKMLFLFSPSYTFLALLLSELSSVNRRHLPAALTVILTQGLRSLWVIR